MPPADDRPTQYGPSRGAVELTTVALLNESSPDPLGLDVETMRALAHHVADLVVDHLAGLRDLPALRTGTPADLEMALGGSLPRSPSDPRAAIADLTEVALVNLQHGGHPRYFARVPGPASFTGVLGDWLATGFNAMAASWAGGSGPAAVELIALDWLATFLGLPPGTTGVMCSGGSLANLTALGAVRERVGPGVCYLTDQTHSSVARALRIIGYPADHIRVVATDARFRMSLDALDAALGEDRASGRRPTVVIATAGTTNTAAVDPLPELADRCDAQGLWLHVDGAYGAPGAATTGGRTLLAGLDRADTLVVDPHKWLFQPYDLGCVLTRHPGLLEAAYSMSPEYLADVTARSGEIDFRNRTPELSRRARGVKLWLTFRVHGADRIRDAIEAGIRTAELAESIIRRDPDWEIVTPAQLGVVTFAHRGAEPGEHSSGADEVTASGIAALTTTTLAGRSVLRLCTINPLTTADDLVATLTALGLSLPDRRS